MDTTDGIQNELEGAITVVHGFEALGYLCENTNSVDLIDVGDNVCIRVFVFEEECGDICSTTPSTDHLLDRTDGSIVLDKD